MEVNVELVSQEYTIFFYFLFLNSFVLQELEWVHMEMDLLRSEVFLMNLCLSFILFRNLVWHIAFMLSADIEAILSLN